MSAIMAGIPGWVIPIIILAVSIVALTIILERGWLLMHQIDLMEIEDERKLLELIRGKKFNDAEAFCRLQSHPGYKVVLSILQNRDSKISFESLAEEENMRQLIYLEKYLPTLGTISTVSPLLGLLGTVTGMIKSFRSFEQTAAKSSQLMGGIDEALITTALGLVVAIPALIMYNYYIRRVNTYSDETNILVQMVIQELSSKKK